MSPNEEARRRREAVVRARTLRRQDPDVYDVIRRLGVEAGLRESSAEARADREAAERIRADVKARVAAERERLIAVVDVDTRGFEALRRRTMEDPEGSAAELALQILEKRTSIESRRRAEVRAALRADEEAIATLAAAPVPFDDPEAGHSFRLRRAMAAVRSRAATMRE